MTLFVLFSQNPTHAQGVEIIFLDSADTAGELDFDSKTDGDLDPGAVLVVARFTGEQANTLNMEIKTLRNGDCEDAKDQLEKIETTLLGFLFPPEEEEPSDHFDDSMDGDHESALASAGFGTDEDYGRFDGGDE